MSSPAGTDTLLDRLLTTSESLRDAARAFAAEEAADLLARRKQLASSLQSALRHTALTGPQRHKLQRATQIGAEAQEALLIKRETTRGELKQALAGHQLNKSFKPYRPKKQGRLNIKL